MAAKLPKALELHPPDSSTPQNATVRLWSVVVWLRTLYNLTTNKADIYRDTLTEALEHPDYIEAAEKNGIDVEALLELLNKFDAATKPPKPAKKKAKA